MFNKVKCNVDYVDYVIVYYIIDFGYISYLLYYCNRFWLN